MKWAAAREGGPNDACGPSMTPKMKRFILDVLRKGSTMTFATVRPDGFPQATTVAYANDGLALYFMCDADSQKVRNITKNPKVSLAVDGDRNAADWNHIHGLSMAATARLVDDPTEKGRAMKLLAAKFPPMADMAEADADASAMIAVMPKVISAINYDVEFGHTDLVRVARADLPPPRSRNGGRHSTRSPTGTT